MKFSDFDFRKIDWLSPKPSKERAVVGAALILLVGGGFLIFHHGRSAPPVGALAAAPDAASAASGRLDGLGGAADAASGPGPVSLTALTAGNCRTAAPGGWRIVDQNPQSTVFTLASADGSKIASYAATAVNGGQAAGAYGPQFRTPETFAIFAAGLLAQEQVQATGPAEAVGYYRAIPIASATRRGYALVYSFAVPADPQGYGVIMRIALSPANDPKALGVTGAVAAAVRCDVQFRPPPQYAQYEPPKDDHGTGRTGSGDDLAGTYNAQLGTGWVHDGAGNNYNVDVADDYHPTGPDGAGYYKRNGNDLIKLQPGLV